MFVESHQCSSDRRFTAEEGADGNDVSVINNNNNYKTKQQNVIPDEPQTFGHMDCPIVPGAIAPISKYAKPVDIYPNGMCCQLGGTIMGFQILCVIF